MKRGAARESATSPGPGKAAGNGRQGTPGTGLVASITAYVIWGFMPLYFSALSAVPPLTVIAHRALWCCVLVTALLAVRGELDTMLRALRDRSTRNWLGVSALLISINWVTYVWGVAHAHVVEASLGYFINPLISIALGVLFLRERLTRVQWLAVALAALGVAWLTYTGGRLPWIALVLAFAFGFYGFARKLVDVEALPGLAAETALVAPLAIAWLLWHGWFGGAVQSTDGGRTTLSLLLVGSGAATAVPLALFAYGARLVPYSTIGIIQYIGPTLQLLLGVLVLGEPFTRQRATGFAFIWTALAIYLIESLWRSRAARRLARATG